MKPIDQQIAIAKICGWSGLEFNSIGQLLGWRGESPQEHGWECAPNYPFDLNACHEMEKALEAKGQFNSFLRQLWSVCCKDDFSVTSGHMDYADLAEVVHATATQRAEAFLRTIGKWTE